MEHVRVEIRPPWPFRLPGGTRDGTTRRRGTVLERLVRRDGVPAVVRIAQPARDRVVIGAWSTGGREHCEHAIARMRFALGVDDDLKPFYDRFRDDPLIGPSVRLRPHLRITRRPEPFEALAWAVCEQLIEFDRAVEIEKRILRRWGHRCSVTGLRDAPDAAAIAGVAPAELQACDLNGHRAITLRHAAKEIAAGRIDLYDPDHETAWRRLRRIPGIGTWTVELLGLLGQGRYDQLPAGDLGYRKYVGRALSGGDGWARVEEDEVRVFFAPYGEWAALAGAHALRGAGLRSPAQLAA